jgi:hypothetical protein
MTVICDACGTENRVRAMFCRGCANKLPAFAPTGTSALETLGVRSSKYEAGASLQRPFPAPETLFKPESVRRWIATLVFFTAVVLGLVAWFAFGHRGASGSATEKLSQPASLPSADTVAIAPVVPDVSATAVGTPGSDPLSPELSLGPDETLEQSGGVKEFDANENAIAAATASASASNGPQASPASASAATALMNRKSTESAATTPSPTPNQRSSTSPGRRAGANTSGNGRAADPRVGCDHLFFAFAARCEANHCQQAAYARHPRCDVVREQRRLDDARRNSLPSH